MPVITKVNLKDEVLGYVTKEEAHRQPCLHRAFSLFLYHDDKMLIQQRAKGKYHSGGLWTNSCCSHPRQNEKLEEAVQSRMLEELGVQCACEEKFSFTYYHKFREDLYEYEVDHVFIGTYTGEIKLNPEEAMDAKWVSFDELETDVLEHPEKYTVWFITALPKVLEYIREKS